MKKLQVHQFDPVIYPFKLWVIVSKDIKTINENFTTLEGDEVRFDIPSKTEAWVGSIPLKYNDLNGVLIAFNDKKVMTIDNVVHETSHVVSTIWNYLGEDSPSSEANAYLAGWIAECIWKVKLNKE